MKMISVCIATYNGEKYIKEQLNSILGQLSENDEIIISDDGSFDRTLDIIKSIDDMRIKVLENQSFKSSIFNFENALNHSIGDIIVLSDQDDIWKENKIEVITKFMKFNDLVISDAEIIDEKGNVIQNSFYSLNNSKNGFVNNLWKNSYLGCTMAFNSKILKKALPFPKDTPMHDWWIGLIGAMYGKTSLIDEKLVSYRRHSENVSTTSQKSRYNFARKIIFRYVMLKNLVFRYFG